MSFAFKYVSVIVYFILRGSMSQSLGWFGSGTCLHILNITLSVDVYTLKFILRHVVDFKNSTLVYNYFILFL